MMRLLSKLIAILLQLAKRDQKVKTDVVLLNRSKILGNNLKYFSFTFCNIMFIRFWFSEQDILNFLAKSKSLAFHQFTLKASLTSSQKRLNTTSSSVKWGHFNPSFSAPTSSSQAKSALLPLLQLHICMHKIIKDLSVFSRPWLGIWVYEIQWHLL